MTLPPMPITPAWPVSARRAGVRAGCSWRTRQTVATEIRWHLAIWCSVCPRSVSILVALRSSSSGFLPTCRPSSLARRMPALTLSTIRLRSSSAIASVCVQSGDVLIGNPKVYPALVEFALRLTIRSQRQQKNRVSQLRQRIGRLNTIRRNISSNSRRDGRTFDDRNPGQLTTEIPPTAELSLGLLLLCVHAGIQGSQFRSQEVVNRPPHAFGPAHSRSVQRE